MLSIWKKTKQRKLHLVIALSESEPWHYVHKAVTMTNPKMERIKNIQNITASLLKHTFFPY